MGAGNREGSGCQNRWYSKEGSDGRDRWCRREEGGAIERSWEPREGRPDTGESNSFTAKRRAAVGHSCRKRWEVAAEIGGAGERRGGSDCQELGIERKRHERERER